MIRRAIRKVVKGEDLSEVEMAGTMEQLLSGAATPAQIGALITALRIKGETVDEIVGAARVIRSKVPKVRLGNPAVNIDRDEINVDEETILHTRREGENGTTTFNVSTATAFVVAAAGVKVAKYGYRAASTQCGSADVLRSLGVKLDINHSNVESCISEMDIGFLYAPFYQGAMRYVAAPRTETGLRSIFNLVGPLTNPGRSKSQVLGVYSPDLTEKMARVLDRLGAKDAFVVFGEGTFDEISICGPTRVSRLKEGEIHTYEMTPEEYGLQRAGHEAIRGGNAPENARIVRAILGGEKGPRRDMVLLNAAAAFVAAGLEPDLLSGIARAAESIDSGRAEGKLEAVIAFTRQCGSFVRRELH